MTPCTIMYKVTVTIETITSVLISGNPSVCLSVHTMFDEQNYYVKPTKTLSDSNIKRQKSSNRMEANNVEVLIQEELFEPFDFLAIGTFGTELLNADPPTPKLPMPSEELTNQQAEITENDLKLINYELEKFLEAEEKENGYDTTSERVSTASIVTLSNKISEKADSEDHMGLMTCPLQDYLFATPVELAETDKEVEKEKKLLEELFKRNNIIPDDLKRNHEVAEQRPRKRDIAHFMKKVVKKFHLSSRSSTASENDAAVSLPIKKKLSKVSLLLVQWSSLIYQIWPPIFCSDKYQFTSN